MSKAILLFFIITYFSFSVANEGMFLPLYFRIVCVFIYSLFNSSVTKKSEMSYARKDSGIIGVYHKILRSVLHSGSHFCTSKKCDSYFTMNYTFKLGFRRLCFYDCN